MRNLPSSTPALWRKPDASGNYVVRFRVGATDDTDDGIVLD